MKIIPPRVEVISMPPYKDALRIIEIAARTCYKSEDKICEGSAEKLIEACIRRGHESVLEHVGFTVRIVCDRGVSHELVRHRTGVAFSQESTRYVRYDGDMEFIEPWWWSNYVDGTVPRTTFGFSCHNDEDAYKELLDMGLPPQAARAVLPNSLATTIVMTANLREWRHIFKLRCDSAAHPDMRRVMGMVLGAAKDNLPVFFDDLEGV